MIKEKKIGILRFKIKKSDLFALLRLKMPNLKRTGLQQGRSMTLFTSLNDVDIQKCGLL